MNSNRKSTASSATSSAKTPKYDAELLGTFFLVFAGTGSIIVNEIFPGRVTPLGIGLVFGLIVMAMIYSIGHISGAHLNPAVTAGFVISGRLPFREAGRYLLAQLSGAVLASALLRGIFFRHATGLGVTLPSGPWWEALALEFFLTFLLMFVIMGVATDHRAQGVMAGVAIGAVIALEALFAGPITGASMNPARSFGPALMAGEFRLHWIYWLAPLAGSAAGAWTYRIIRCDTPSAEAPHGCC